MEWTDPDNWSSEKTNAATPHVERIPCVHDTVVFNPGNSFSVVVPNVPISVGAVQYGNEVSELVGRPVRRRIVSNNIIVQ